MKFLLALSGLAFAALAAAQAGVPACVITCSMQAATAAGCSSYFDSACVCTSAAFQNAAGACLVKNCSTADQGTASELHTALCGTQSVTSGTVTATVASATGTTSLDTSSIAALTTNSASLSSLTSSIAASVSSGTAPASNIGSVTTGAATVGGATSAANSAGNIGTSSSSVASAATSSAASSGEMLHLGFKGLLGMGMGVVGVVAGAVMVV